MLAPLSARANGQPRGEELSDDVDARFGELEAEIEPLEAKRQADDPDDIARGGAFVILNHDGTTIRIERGFIRPDDEKPQPETEQGGDADASEVERDADARVVQGGEGDEGAKRRGLRPGRCLTFSFATHRTLGSASI